MIRYTVLTMSIPQNYYNCLVIPLPSDTPIVDVAEGNTKKK